MTHPQGLNHLYTSRSIHLKYIFLVLDERVPSADVVDETGLIVQTAVDSDMVDTTSGLSTFALNFPCK